MKWALVDAQNIVKNIIVYDGVSPYRVPDGLSLMQINDWVGREEPVNKEAPLPPSRPSDEDVKLKRNEAEKNNLALKAVYLIEKRRLPNLTFSDYLDQLEAEVI